MTVLTIDESNEKVISGVYKAIKEYNSTHFDTLTLRKVKVNATTNAEHICEKVFENEIKASLIIDATAQSSVAAIELKRLARKLRIPTISTNSKTQSEWRDLSEDESQVLLYFKSPSSLVVNAVKDIVHFHDYSKFAVLHDHTFDSEEIGSMFAGNDTLEIHFRSLENDNISEFENLVRMLKKRKKENLVTFFVLAKAMTINKFMEAITFNDMFRLPYVWYFLTKVDVYFYYDLTRLVLQSIDRSFDSLKWAHTRVLPSCQQIQGSTVEKCENSYLRHKMEIEVDDFHGKFGEFVINCKGSLENYQSIYLRLKEQKYRFEMKSRVVAEWEYGEPSGSIMFTSASEEGGEEDKSNIVIQVLLHPPYVMKLTENSSDGTQSQTVGYYGFLIDLLKEIEKQIPDFPKYTIVEYNNPEGLYGHFETGSKNKQDEGGELDGGEEGGDGEGGGAIDPKWKGAIVDIVNKKNILSLGAWTQTLERENYTIFSEPFFELVGLSILMKRPKRQIFYYKFLNVLEGSVWICITGAYFLTSFLLTIFDRYSPYSYQNNKLKYKEDEEKRVFSLKESMWFCITSLTPQGGGEAPKSLSGRLVAATWWLFGFIVVASYSANLAAFLTVSRIDSRVTSFYSLSKQYKVRYAPVALSAIQTYFNRLSMVEEKFYEVWKDMSLSDSLSEDDRAKLAIWDYPISDRFTKIWAQVTEAKAPKSFEEALRRVKQSKNHKDGFALITDAHTVEYFSITHCDVHKVGYDFAPRPLGLAMSKQLKWLKEKIDPVIVRFRNDRTIERIKEKWWDNNPLKEKCEDNRQLYNGISLNNAGGTFIVIIAGVCATCFAVAVENYFIKRMIISKFNEIQFGKTEHIPNRRRFGFLDCFAFWKKNR